VRGKYVVGSCNIVFNVISPHLFLEEVWRNTKRLKITGSYAESLSRSFINKEQKYWYCPFDGKARLLFLWVLYYVEWIRVINWELCVRVNRSCMLFLRKYYKLYLELTYSVFLDFARRRWWLVIDVAGQIICPILSGQIVQEHTWNTWPKKNTRWMSFPESSSTKYQPTPLKVPEERPKLLVHSYIYREVWGKSPRSLPCELTACGHKFFASLCFILFIRF
jgi:hypothetical protein